MKRKITAVMFVVLLALSFVSCNTSASDSSVGEYNSEISEDTATVKVTTEEAPQETTVSTTSTTESKTEPVTASADEYILPYSDTKKLTDSDLSELSEEQLVLARNEIYARHGRKFNTDYIQEYFNSKSWYKGTVNPDDFTEDMLNDIEIYNISFIKEAEEEAEEKAENSCETTEFPRSYKAIDNYSDSDWSGNSSSYSNGQYYNEPSSCKICGGTGDCLNCYGTGNCEYCHGTRKINCIYCSYGKCGACGGRGYVYKYVGILFDKYTCTTCNGTGDCNYCNGSRQINCTRCHGSGSCGDCNGTGNCQYCGGSGYQY